MMEITATTATIFLNMIADVYFRAKEICPEITPDNIKNYIADLERKAEENNSEMGIT
jgi:hypothetical protein